MSPQDLIVRPAKLEDSETIWRIRFNTSVRDTALSAAMVDFTTHQVWFKEKYFSGGGNCCFVLEERGQVVGYCRYDLDQDGQYLISIGFVPAHQRRGLGAKLLHASRDRLGLSRPVIALIKKNNMASIKFFTKNNFRPDGENGGAYRYRSP